MPVPNSSIHAYRGWSAGAMVLVKLPVPERPTNLVYSRAKVCGLAVGAGWGLFFGHFSSRPSVLFLKMA